MNLYIGIDIGGTSVKYGLATAEGELREHDEEPTAQGGRNDLLDQLADIVKRHDASSVRAVGVGTAGAVDFSSGSVVGHSPNIAHWENTPVAAELGRRTSLPVTVDNDANCMAFAESRVGAGRDAQSLFFLTLGTGVGSAVVTGGRLWRGAHSLGGEWGHATIVADGRLCSCGQRGHLEAYASATALVARTLELARGGAPSKFAAEPDTATSRLGSKEIFEAAGSGDAAALQAIDETVAYLAIGIASAVNLLDPERVVVGGGMAAGGGDFLARVEAQVKTRVHAGLTRYVSVVPAQLGNRAGLIGAAILAAESVPSEP